MDFKAPTTQIWHYWAYLHEPQFQLFGNKYVIDMFTWELKCHLQHIHSNQERLKSMETDATLMAEDTINESENIYLPASFLRSWRWVSNQITNSLTITAVHGLLTSFITFTCNSNWPEIQSQLQLGQNLTDIEVVVCHVFKQKNFKLMSTLFVMFPNTGHLIYSITSIEFQKWGLLHAYILLKYNKVCISAKDIDQVISAIIPDDPSDVELAKKFIKHHPTPMASSTTSHLIITTH